MGKRGLSCQSLQEESRPPHCAIVPLEAAVEQRLQGLLAESQPHHGTKPASLQDHPHHRHQGIRHRLFLRRVLNKFGMEVVQTAFETSSTHVATADT